MWNGVTYQFGNIKFFRYFLYHSFCFFIFVLFFVLSTLGSTLVCQPVWTCVGSFIVRRILGFFLLWMPQTLLFYQYICYTDLERQCKALWWQRRRKQPQPWRPGTSVMERETGWGSGHNHLKPGTNLDVNVPLWYEALISWYELQLRSKKKTDAFIKPRFEPNFKNLMR